VAAADDPGPVLFRSSENMWGILHVLLMLVFTLSVLAAVGVVPMRSNHGPLFAWAVVGMFGSIWAFVAWAIDRDVTCHASYLQVHSRSSSFTIPFSQITGAEPFAIGRIELAVVRYRDPAEPRPFRVIFPLSSRDVTRLNDLRWGIKNVSTRPPEPPPEKPQLPRARIIK
jgi:hypothetical protein